jgi:hypothetical protein
LSGIISAMTLVRARANIVRLLAYTVNLDRLFSAWVTTERFWFDSRPRYGRHLRQARHFENVLHPG